MERLGDGGRAFTFTFPMAVKGPHRWIAASRRTQPAVRATLDFERKMTTILQRFGEVLRKMEEVPHGR